jgi:hypothetical protein
MSDLTTKELNEIFGPHHYTVQKAIAEIERLEAENSRLSCEGKLKDAVIDTADILAGVATGGSDLEIMQAYADYEKARAALVSQGLNHG